MGSFYREHVLPHLIDIACGMREIGEQRTRIVPQAEGRVLDVGTGSGLNLSYYDPARVDQVWALEPSAGMRRKARRNLERAPCEVRWIEASGKAIPLDDHSVDTVVMTYTLCTIEDWRGALDEMRRVVKPGGRLLFCEHGAAPDAAVRRWQDRLNPLWRPVAGGCNLNRPIPELIEQGGFGVCGMETGYLPRTPRLLGFNYWGAAAPR